MATASTCDEPRWAHECLKKFKIGPDLDITMGTVFKHNEIYKVQEIYLGRDFWIHCLIGGRKKIGELYAFSLFANSDKMVVSDRRKRCI